MLDVDDTLRQRSLMSRLLRGGWYRLLEDSRMKIPCRGGHNPFSSCQFVSGSAIYAFGLL